MPDLIPDMLCALQNNLAGKMASLGRLFKRRKITLAYIYGSCATGRTHARSDADICFFEDLPLQVQYEVIRDGIVLLNADEDRRIGLEHRIMSLYLDRRYYMQLAIECMMDIGEIIISERGLRKPQDGRIQGDPSKALKKAVRKVFGEKFPTQPRVRHKERNIVEYTRELSRRVQAPVEDDSGGSKLSAGPETLRSVEMLAIQDQPGSVGESGRIRDGDIDSDSIGDTCIVAQDTFVHQSDRIALFQCSLSDRASQELEERYGSGIAMASVALLEAQKKFHIIRGYREIPVLMSALKNLGLPTQAQVV